MYKYFLTALLVLATSTGLSAQIDAGPHRPGNVPAGYVVTPFGYFHPSCVQSIADDDALQANGQVQHRDGSVAGNTTCNYPRYAPDGTLKGATAKQQVPEISGWIESASVTAPTNKSFSALYAASTVPSQPKAQDGQVLFLFPGFEDINNTESILQPVITWSAGQWTVSKLELLLERHHHAKHADRCPPRGRNRQLDHRKLPAGNTFLRHLEHLQSGYAYPQEHHVSENS